MPCNPILCHCNCQQVEILQAQVRELTERVAQLERPAGQDGIRRTAGGRSATDLQYSGGQAGQFRQDEQFNWIGGW